MADFLPLPEKEYSVIYADPPWEYRQHGTTEKSRGTALKQYPTMTTADICNLPVFFFQLLLSKIQLVLKFSR